MDRWVNKVTYVSDTDPIGIRSAVARDLANAGVRAARLAHLDLAGRDCSYNYYYSRNQNVGPTKTETVTEEHWTIRDDGKLPIWDRENRWWHWRSPSYVRARELAIKPLGELW